MNESLLSVARQAALIGGNVVTRYYHEGVTMRSKAAADLVSDADVNSEHAIVDYLREAAPGHAVLGEEAHGSGDTTAEHLWIIDPIDGTTNFAHQIPHFAVSVAYFHRGISQCGVIYNPIREEWFTAERGKGAFAGDRRVHVGPQSQLNEVLIGVGFYYDRGAMMEATLAAVRDLFRCQIHGIRRFGTASLDLVHVGLGYYAAYFEYTLAPWDFAAGQLFVVEAGGRVTTARGEKLPIARSSLLASNGLLHDDVLAVVGKHHPA